MVTAARGSDRAQVMLYHNLPAMVCNVEGYILRSTIGMPFLGTIPRPITRRPCKFCLALTLQQRAFYFLCPSATSQSLSNAHHGEPVLTRPDFVLLLRCSIKEPRISPDRLRCIRKQSSADCKYGNIATWVGAGGIPYKVTLDQPFWLDVWS